MFLTDLLNLLPREGARDELSSETPPSNDVAESPLARSEASCLARRAVMHLVLGYPILLLSTIEQCSELLLNCR